MHLYVHKPLGASDRKLSRSHTGYVLVRIRDCPGRRKTMELIIIYNLFWLVQVTLLLSSLVILYCINDSQKSAYQLVSQWKQNWCTRPSSRFRESMKMTAGLLSGWNIFSVFWGIYSRDCCISLSDVLFIAWKSNYTVVYFSHNLRKQSNNALVGDYFTDFLYVYIKIN